LIFAGHPEQSRQSWDTVCQPQHGRKLCPWALVGQCDKHPVQAHNRHTENQEGILYYGEILGKRTKWEEFITLNLNFLPPFPQKWFLTRPTWETGSKAQQLNSHKQANSKARANRNLGNQDPRRLPGRLIVV
jgi:hypothetical protein